MMKENDFFIKIIDYSNTKKKYPEIDMLLYQNSESILKAINMKIPIKHICEVIKQETNINVSYQTLYAKIKKLTEISNSSNIIITSQNKINKTYLSKLNNNEEINKEENKGPLILKSNQKTFTYNNEK